MFICMYKSNYIVLCSLHLRSTMLPPQAFITATFGSVSALPCAKYTLMSHTGQHEEHRFFSSVLISSLWNGCIFFFHPTMFELFLKLRGLNAAAQLLRVLRRVTSGLATENIQALYCPCANPVPGSGFDQRRTH